MKDLKHRFRTFHCIRWLLGHGSAKAFPCSQSLISCFVQSAVRNAAANTLQACGKPMMVRVFRRSPKTGWIASTCSRMLSISLGVVVNNFSRARNEPQKKFAMVDPKQTTSIYTRKKTVAYCCTLATTSISVTPLFWRMMSPLEKLDSSILEKPAR